MRPWLDRVMKLTNPLEQCWFRDGNWPFFFCKTFYKVFTAALQPVFDDWTQLEFKSKTKQL